MVFICFSADFQTMDNKVNSSYVQGLVIKTLPEILKDDRKWQLAYMRPEIGALEERITRKINEIEHGTLTIESSNISGQVQGFVHLMKTHDFLWCVYQDPQDQKTVMVIYYIGSLGVAFVDTLSKMDWPWEDMGLVECEPHYLLIVESGITNQARQVISQKQMKIEYLRHSECSYRVSLNQNVPMYRKLTFEEVMRRFPVKKVKNGYYCDLKNVKRFTSEDIVVKQYGLQRGEVMEYKTQYPGIAPCTCYRWLPKDYDIEDGKLVWKATFASEARSE